jgi:ABC-type transport system involved in multi-copper enzyme maturation permease subunit
MNRNTVLIRIFYITFIVYLIVGIGTVFIEPRNPDMLAWLMTQIILTVVIAPALMATSFTKEYELGNIDMLRMTLLTPRDIVLGKMWAGAASVAPALLAALVTGIPAVFIGMRTRQWPVMLTGYVTLFVCTLVSLSLGLSSSLVTKRTTASLALSYILSILVFVGFSGAAAYLAYEVFEDLRHHPITNDVIMFLSPIGAFFYNALPDKYIHEHGSPLNSYWLGNVSVFTLFALILIKVTVIGFERYRMRDR